MDKRKELNHHPANMLQLYSYKYSYWIRTHYVLHAGAFVVGGKRTSCTAAPGVVLRNVGFDGAPRQRCAAALAISSCAEKASCRQVLFHTRTNARAGRFSGEAVAALPTPPARQPAVLPLGLLPLLVER
jgi:hypothetical protein